MKNKLFSAISAAAASVFLLGNVAVSGNVVEVTKDSFDSIINQDLVMVEFFAPWCTHCKALKPEYEKAADELKSSNITLAAVDCTVEQEICSAQGVQGYPTIKVFRNGVASDYSKARNSDAITSYLKKALLPALSEISDSSSLSTFIQKDKVVVMGYFESKSDPEYVVFESFASKARDDFLFGVTLNEELAKQEAVTFPAVVLYKQFDEKKNVYPENALDALTEQSSTSAAKIDLDTLAKFVKVNAVPLVNDIGPENYSKYIESGLPIVFAFVANEEHRATFAPILDENAKKYRGKINFVYTDANLYGGHAANLNLKQEWPCLGIQLADSQAKYPFDQSLDITPPNVAKFLEDFVSGKIKPSIKSAPIPETNDEPVKVVVADSFVDIVLDKSKDVFVEFYAPWCGHCKRLAPIWDDLALKVQPSSHIVIAKMDATENDIPPEMPLHIEGFPTLKLFKAKTNEVVDYNGERTLESLLDFLKTNADSGPFNVGDIPEADSSDKDHDEL